MLLLLFCVLENSYFSIKIHHLQEVGEMGRCWSKGKKWQLCRMNKSINLMSSIMAIANNTVLDTWNLLRQKISGDCTTKKKRTTPKTDIVISSTMIIISLDICLSKYHAGYLKYMQFLFFKKSPNNIYSMRERIYNCSFPK